MNYRPYISLILSSALIVPIIAPLASCSQPKDEIRMLSNYYPAKSYPVGSDLEGKINSLADEVVRRGEIRPHPAGTDYTLHIKDNWIILAAEELESSPTPLSARNDKILSILDRLPLAVRRIDVTKQRTENTYELVIYVSSFSDGKGVSSNDHYDDKFSFFRMGNVLINWPFKDMNIEAVQAAYGVSRESAIRRLDEWLPQILDCSIELFIPPIKLPNEPWVPREMQGNPTAGLKYLQRKQ